MKILFDEVSLKCSRITTHSYSTSFSLGIRLLKKTLRKHIYTIYAFVRFADEIVDTFHNYDKEKLLNKFERDTYEAIALKISLNPILNSFQHTVNAYGLERSSIGYFLRSMRMDLNKKTHSRESFNDYVLGSAEIVGLMCLRVFCEGNDTQYETLKPYAMRLGAAFQKVNFLRDIHADHVQLGRSYFPDIAIENFDEQIKAQIESEIYEDFQNALQGIKMLPPGCKLGVYLAYIYYLALFKKIIHTPHHRILRERTRIPNIKKCILLIVSYLKFRLRLI